ncbi:hypothetical protein ACQ859_01500 [Roseateles chitinivorans]|uniref:hypothetical protein n=1 Tax=Roseateles chitinivorans TaxID=2917965 RepID=UPI003D66CA7D
MGSPGKKQFPLRLDPALWEEIERLAAIELRSSNAQIELLLREALRRRGIKPALSPAPRRGRPPVGGVDAAIEGDEVSGSSDLSRNASSASSANSADDADE